MKKKIVVFGGGNGLSYLLRGLKQFPLDITAIVSVCDDGKSTGILREEFNVPAVGDIRRVLVSLSETEPLVEELFNYRFNTTSDLNGHTVGNLLLTAMREITGNLSDGIESLSRVLNLKGKVVPLTEDNVVLMGEMEDGNIVEGEHNITIDKRKIKRVYYKEEPKATKEALKAIKDADVYVPARIMLEKEEGEKLQKAIKAKGGTRWIPPLFQVPTGFEPVNNGFADRPLRPLGYSTITPIQRIPTLTKNMSECKYYVILTCHGPDFEGQLTQANGFGGADDKGQSAERYHQAGQPQDLIHNQGQ